MADVKISALPLATTPLAGTEVLPIVQSATTDQVSVANLTAGRSVSAASLTLTTTPLAVGSGGTGLSTLTAGYIPYGNGTSAFGSSVNLFWDSANARLGIGTSSPSYTLDVAGVSRITAGGGWSAGNYGKQLYITTPLFNSNPCIGLSDASGSNNWAIANNSGALVFTQMPAFTDGSTANTERMRIDSSGNVGIGTPSPAAKLDVYTASGGVYQLVRSGGSTASDYGYIRAGAGSTNVFNIAYGNGTAITYSDTTSSYTVGTSNNAPLILYTNNAEKMRIDSSGNVGIGTASPGTYKLNVVNSASNLALFSGNNANNFIAISDNGGTTTCSFGSISGGNSYTFTAGYHATYAGNSERFRVDASGNIICNTAAIATTATDGFLYVPTCAGTPTGTPTTYTGRAPIVVNTTNNKLYFYSGGAWRDAGP
jgi:hypothetical protein